MFDQATNVLSNPLVAGVASFTSTLGLAAGALPVPEGVPQIVPYLVSILGPVLVAVLMRVLAANAAKKRALAEALERRVKALREDKNPANDGEADKLEDKAVELRAEAAALEAAKK